MSNSLISLGLGFGGGKASTSNGRISGDATPFTNAYSVDFDGSDDYIDCGGDADFSFTDGSGNDSAFSISAWVKLDDNIRGRIVSKGNVEWLFGTDGTGKISLILYSNDDSGNNLFLRESTALSTGTWHHLVATYDGSETIGGMNLYRAGTTITTETNSQGTYTGMASQQGSLRIGQWALNGSVMNGLVDEVAVFDYELSASQVSDIYNSGVPTDITSLNPVGWWRMGDNDEGTGTTITDQGSGGNDGTLTNGPTFSTDRPYALPSITNTYSVDFDGTDDLMSLGTTLDFNFDSSDTFTISQWVKFDALSTLNRIFFRHNGGSAGYNLYYQNGLGWRLYTNAGYTLSTASVSTGQWYHVVLVYDTQDVTLYVDNTSLGTTSSVPISSAGAITASVSSSVYPTNGKFDEVSLYTSALRSSDVSAIYNSGTPADVSSLSPFGWWRMGDDDGGTGTTITDQGSGGNDGTLTNGPTFSTDTP